MGYPVTPAYAAGRLAVHRPVPGERIEHVDVRRCFQEGGALVKGQHAQLLVVVLGQPLSSRLGRLTHLIECLLDLVENAVMCSLPSRRARS